MSAFLAMALPVFAAQDDDLVLDDDPIRTAVPGAAPPPQSEGETLRARLVGKVHTGRLDIKGWEGLGGGLMTNSLSWSYYRRPGNTWLVLIETRGRRIPGAAQATFRVSDVLFLQQLGRDQEISFDCRYMGQRQTKRIISVIQPDHSNEREWWRDIRQSWQIAENDGRITPISPSGIECVNEGWGL